MVKTLFQYMEELIPKEKITDEKIFFNKLNFENLLKRAFFNYLIDQGKVEELDLRIKANKDKRDRRKIKW